MKGDHEVGPHEGLLHLYIYIIVRAFFFDLSFWCVVGCPTPAFDQCAVCPLLEECCPGDLPFGRHLVLPVGITLVAAGLAVVGGMLDWLEGIEGSSRLVIDRSLCIVGTSP